MRENIDTVLGLVLAGGMSQRMQPLATAKKPIDKCLLEWQNEPLIAHVIRKASPQVADIFISSNSSDESYSQLNLTVLADDEDIKQCGPLSGILTALRWIKSQNLPHRWLATFPGDTPNLPSDIVKRLLTAQDNLGTFKIISLQTNERKQPLFSLWSRENLEPLEIYLANDGRKVMQFIDEQPHCYVTVKDAGYALKNINTPKDWGEFSERSE